MKNNAGIYPSILAILIGKLRKPNPIILQIKAQQAWNIPILCICSSFIKFSYESEGIF